MPQSGKNTEYIAILPIYGPCRFSSFFFSRVHFNRTIFYTISLPPPCCAMRAVYLDDDQVGYGEAKNTCFVILAICFRVVLVCARLSCAIWRKLSSSLLFDFDTRKKRTKTLYLTDSFSYNLVECFTKSIHFGIG